MSFGIGWIFCFTIYLYGPIMGWIEYSDYTEKIQYNYR